jgi:hypothetical protein
VNLKDFSKLSISHEQFSLPDLHYYTDLSVVKSHSKMSKVRRSGTPLSSDPQLPIENILLYHNSQSQPLLFQETYRYPALRLRGTHLIVLVHGYKGCTEDLHVLKNYIKLAYPDSMILNSRANQDDTDCSIEVMAARLVKEINLLTDEMVCGFRDIRISFVAQSMGGLVVRAALPSLDKWRDKMHAFISFFSPHLGCFGSSSRLVDAGLWLLRHFTSSVCLNQLSMTDASAPESTFLYHLSCFPGLSWFKYVTFISALQDAYVPLDSARVQISKRTRKSQSRADLYMSMARNILSQLVSTEVTRINVALNITAKNIDSVIGRTAHLQFMENESLIRMLVYAYPQFFK